MSDHGNLQRRLNTNKAHQFLIDYFHRQIVRFVQQTAVCYVLDPDSGEGFMLAYFRQSGLDVTAVGFAFSLETIYWAKPNLLLDLNGTIADTHYFPFADRSFLADYSS